MEIQKTPLVSVIMPSYHAEAFVEETVRSVMNQTMEDWELIIIDDCSKDGTFELLRSLAQCDSRIRVERNERNSGVAVTRNRGLDLARGTYAAFIDSDDAWYPEKLARQIQRLQDTGADFSYCSYEIVGFSGEKARPDYIVPPTVTFEELLKENVILCSSLLIRMEALKDIRFTTDFYHEDFVLELDLLKQGFTAAGCTEILARWRYIENSRSFNKWKSAQNRWKIYRHYLKLTPIQSASPFIHYFCAGLRKYFIRHKNRGGS